MAKTRYVTESQLMLIGRRYSADAVALEAVETQARWQHDVGALGPYGYGQSLLDAFTTDTAQHAKLRATRPEAVTEKKVSVVMRDKQVSQGWAWVDKVCSFLGVLARTDQTLDTAVRTATPTDDAGLEAGIRALATILNETKARLPTDVRADERLAEVEALCQALRASPGAVHTSKGQAVADTAQLDLFDGKLYVCMRDLNSAARKAIRNGDLDARLSDYTFHHLKRSGNPNPAPAAKVEPGAAS